jgi:hypothetical protein
MKDVADTAIVVFDDIYWSAGMRRALSLITEHPMIAASVDLFRLGICVVEPTRGHAQKYRLVFG